MIGDRTRRWAPRARPDGDEGDRTVAPGPAVAALPRRRIPRVVQQSIGMEAAGGLLLLAAAVVAVVWANSPWRAS